MQVSRGKKWVNYKEKEPDGHVIYLQLWRLKDNGANCKGLETMTEIQESYTQASYY